MTTIEKRINDAVVSMEYAADVAEQFVDPDNVNDIPTKSGFVKPMAVSVAQIEGLSASVQNTISDLESSAIDRISKIANFSKEVFLPSDVYAERCFFVEGGVAYTPISYPYTAGESVLLEVGAGRLRVLQGLSSTDLGDSPYQIPSNKGVNFRGFDCLVDAIDFVATNPESISLLRVLSRRSSAECVLDGVQYPDDGAADYKIVNVGVADGVEFIEAGVKYLQLIVGSSGPTLAQFGGVSDSGYDNKAAINLAEQSSFSSIDLLGGVYDTSTDPVLLIKNYHSGSVIGVNIDGNREVLGVSARLALADGPRLKSGIVDWQDKRILWLGTSIPHQGVGVDGYPEQFGDYLGCDVVNMAWSGSHATFHPNESAFDRSTIASLSMTEQDRLLGLSQYGVSSAYDSSFNAVTKAVEMTADYRIRNQFGDVPIDVVVLDHNHNDRRSSFGELDPTPVVIIGITLGLETSITLSDVSGFSVGSAVVLDISGVPQLQNCAAVIVRVSGNDVVLAVDSSAYSGFFSSGSLVMLDRATIYGAWAFLINYILWCANELGQTAPAIILASAPSEFTNNTRDNSIFSNSRALESVSSKFNAPFFDVSQSLKIGESDHSLYFEDVVHAITPSSRSVIARHWIKWALGGVATGLSRNQGLASVQGVRFNDGMAPVFSEVLGGFHSPLMSAGAYSQVLTESFSQGFSAWSVSGATPVINAGRLEFDSSAGTTFVSKSVSFDRVVDLSLNVNIQSVSGLIDQGVLGITLINLHDSDPGGTGSSIIVQMVVRAGGVELRAKYFGVPVDSGFASVPVIKSIGLQSGVDHSVRLYFHHQTAGSDGFLVLYVDGEKCCAGELNNVLQSKSNGIKLGILDEGFDSPVLLRVSNLDIKAAPLLDTSSPFTGSIQLLDSKVAQVIDGRIFGVV